MALVKICGLTRAEDVTCAVAAGVDALGFNFYPQSPRFIDQTRAKALIALVPPTVWKVGLFVDEPVAKILDTAARVGIDTIQLLCRDPELERSSLAQSKAAGYRVLLTRRVNESSATASLAPLQAEIDYLLLDVLSAKGLGGTGHQIADSVLTQLEQSNLLKTSFLAGGLTPENIGEKVARFAPFGVDVASGVESAPGIKSAERMQRFIAEAKRPVQQP